MDEPWRSCLALAWEAYLEGTIPVGAVVVDARGVIVARGRNRIFAPSGTGLAGTRLAHAEVEALAQLRSTTRYEDHTVYSALEPCPALIASMLQSSFWLRRDSELAPRIVETFGDEARERAKRLHAENGALPRDFDAALPRLRALL